MTTPLPPLPPLPLAVMSLNVGLEPKSVLTATPLLFWKVSLVRVGLNVVMRTPGPPEKFTALFVNVIGAPQSLIAGLPKAPA